MGPISFHVQFQRAATIYSVSVFRAKWMRPHLCNHEGDKSHGQSFELNPRWNTYTLIRNNLLSSRNIIASFRVEITGRWAPIDLQHRAASLIFIWRLLWGNSTKNILFFIRSGINYSFIYSRERPMKIFHLVSNGKLMSMVLLWWWKLRVSIKRFR